MPTKVIPGPIDGNSCTSFKEAVCIHTNKIYDSCKDKDCIEDLRVYPTVNSQPIIENATSVRARGAELLYVSTEVEEVSFNRGFYTVDTRYYYKIIGEAYSPVSRTAEIEGLAVFDKRVILFGSEGSAKIFASNVVLGGEDTAILSLAKLPTAIVEAVDPIILSLKLIDINDFCDISPDRNIGDVPAFIENAFSSPISFTPQNKRLLVSLGQFSIVRIERDSQLLIPAYDYCVPDKECTGGGNNEDDPCSLFSKICFPVDEFFPPDATSSPEGYREAIASLTR